MLCGDFWMYRGLRIPAFDGMDCGTLEAFVEVFACLMYVFAGCIFIGGFTSDDVRSHLVGIFWAGICVVLAPFFLYILVFSWVMTALFALFLPCAFVFDLVQSRMSRGRIEPVQLEGRNQAILSDVKIHNGDIVSHNQIMNTTGGNPTVDRRIIIPGISKTTEEFDERINVRDEKSTNRV